jgi:hypothetical protein
MPPTYQLTNHTTHRASHNTQGITQHTGHHTTYWASHNTLTRGETG